MSGNDFNEVLKYIDEHIYGKISLKELADFVGYSPFHFSKSFSLTYGIPVTGYIRIRKLQYALGSLLEGKKVLEVSLMYAFESHEGFTRSFTRLFGSTPSTVKKYLASYQIPDWTQFGGKVINQYMGDENMNLNDNMHQLVYEMIKCSIEEAKAGFCTEVTVQLKKNNVVVITDNGRGMPLGEENQKNKEVLDRILAGHPITQLEYAQMGDLPIEGLRVVNSLCESFNVNVYREGKCFSQDYIRGIAQHEITCTETKHQHGMELIIKPDSAIFGECTFSKEKIADWTRENGVQEMVEIHLISER